MTGCDRMQDMEDWEHFTSQTTDIKDVVIMCHANVNGMAVLTGVIDHSRKPNKIGPFKGGHFYNDARTLAYYSRPRCEAMKRDGKQCRYRAYAATLPFCRLHW